MDNLRYEAPDTLDAAVALLGGEKGDVRILAGGTDVLVQLHFDQIGSALLVDVKNIPELSAISAEEGGFRIGAAVSGMEIVEHEGLAKARPGVIDGVKLIGSIQIKGRATMGGNLCNASPAADSVPALIAAGATARIVGPKGARDVPVEEVATGPGKTSLAKDEILVSFFLPARAVRSGGAYQRFTPRTEMDIAVVGVGIDLTLDEGGTCTAARVVLGAVAERAIVAEDAAAALIGTKPSTMWRWIIWRRRRVPRPGRSTTSGAPKNYRVKVAGVLAKRAAAIALDRARQG